MNMRPVLSFVSFDELRCSSRRVDASANARVVLIITMVLATVAMADDSPSSSELPTGGSSEHQHFQQQQQGPSPTPTRDPLPWYFHTRCENGYLQPRGKMPRSSLMHFVLIAEEQETDPDPLVSNNGQQQDTVIVSLCNKTVKTPKGATPCPVEKYFAARWNSTGHCQAVFTEYSSLRRLGGAYVLDARGRSNTISGSSVTETLRVTVHCARSAIAPSERFIKTSKRSSEFQLAVGNKAFCSTHFSSVEGEPSAALPIALGALGFCFLVAAIALFVRRRQRQRRVRQAAAAAASREPDHEMGQGEPDETV